MAIEDAEFYREFWQSPEWGGSRPNADEKSRLAAIVDAIQCFAPAGRDLQVLDVGCGRGWLTAELQELLGHRIAHTVGIDPVEPAISRAQALFPELEFHVCDYQLRTGAPLGTFDIVTCSEVIEHVPDAQKLEFLRTAATFLRPAGLMVLTTPRRELWTAYKKQQQGCQPVEEWLSARELLRIIERAGLKTVSHRRVFYDGIKVHPSEDLLRRLRLQSLVAMIAPLREYMDRINSIYQLVACRVECKVIRLLSQ